MELAESPILHEKDLAAYSQTFKSHQLLAIDQFLPDEYINETLAPLTTLCAPYVHRVYVPNFKKSGSISSQILQKQAKPLFDLYHSKQMKSFIESVVGESVSLCPDDDPHAVALYYYTEPGDHIGVHYDKSFYKGKRYTVLLGLVQDSTQSNLVCYLGANKLNRRKNPKTVVTKPGTLVIFNGDTLWHEVTPLGDNERRVILTMEYVTDNTMTPLNRFISTTKDRFLYFGKQKK